MQYDEWLMRPLSKPDAATEIYCFPHAGAGASTFSSWARRIGDEIDLMGIQLPGRESRFRQQPLFDIEAIVQSTASAIEANARRPLVLYGHSFGARIAFLTAARLLVRGLPVRHLVVSAAASPTHPRHQAPIHGLPEDEFVRALSERYDGIPAAVLQDRELLTMCLPALRADLFVLETDDQTSATAIDCPITALAGQQDPMSPPSAMQAWRALSTVGFDLHEFDGGHFFIKEHLGDVLECLRAICVDPLHLDEARFA